VGAGIYYSRAGRSTITNCTFTGNRGHVIYNYERASLTAYEGASLTVTSCTFTDNRGNGIYNINGGAPLTVTDCIFSGNSGGDGSGIYHKGSLYNITNCIFSGNHANGSGGGVFIAGGSRESSRMITNCTFVGNSAYYRGGGIYNGVVDAPPIITNCTFNGNSAEQGGGIFNFWSGIEVTNCILWGDTASEGSEIYNYNPFHEPIIINFSDVEGGYPGNIDADPLFMGNPLYSGTWSTGPNRLSDVETILTDDSASWASLSLKGLLINPDTGQPRNGPVLYFSIIDNTSTTVTVLGDAGIAQNGDGYEIYDYHLQAGSPCIDAGQPGPEYYDPDGTRNDIGAYGGPNATVFDRDDDGMPDWWEDLRGFDPLDSSDASVDEEPDGLINLEEYNNDTDPFDTDTDNGHAYDGREVDSGTDPNLWTDDILPIPDAGPDDTVNLNDPVQLDGTNSTDPLGEPITQYTWAQVAGPASMPLSDPFDPQPTFTATWPGVFTFSLGVDVWNASSFPPDYVEITVQP